MKAFIGYMVWNEDFSEYDIRFNKELIRSNECYDDIVIITPDTYTLHRCSNGVKALFEVNRYVDPKTDDYVSLIDICTY